MCNFMKRTIEELEKERKELYEKAHNIEQEISELKIKDLNLDYEGKYIKYKDDYETEHYCYVTTIMKDTYVYHGFDISYMLRGLGFYGEFTGYGDATSFCWSYWHEIYIYAQSVEEFKKKTENITEITKEEFNKAFYGHVEKLLEYNEGYSYDN